MTPSWYRPKQANPDTAVQVRLSTHKQRLEVAYLTTQLRNWRNGTSHRNATLRGVKTQDAIDIPGDLPNYYDYAVLSMGKLIILHDSRLVEVNSHKDDYRELVSEWEYMPILKLSSEVQRHHLSVLVAYIEPFYSYDVLPPSVSKTGHARYSISNFKPRDDSDPKPRSTSPCRPADSGDDEMGPEYYGAI